jgi:putative redox protein
MDCIIPVMVTITCTYQGELRVGAVHGPSATTLCTDAPVDNQGRGESFSPTDLVATALGSCVLTILGIAARRDGLALEGARVLVEKHMSSDTPRRIARLVVHHHLPAGIPVEQRAKLERAARTCPVRESINPAIVLDEHWHWG